MIKGNFDRQTVNLPSRHFISSTSKAFVGLLLGLLAGPFAAADATLQQQLDAAIADTLNGSGGALHSIVLQLDAPGKDFHYLNAMGQLNATSQQAITADDRFFIASISKTMTAVRVLQLAEQGLLSIDSKIADLGIFEPAVIAALHQINGQSYGSDITIRQLLSHRSGMKDYLLDDRSGISDAFVP